MAKRNWRRSYYQALVASLDFMTDDWCLLDRKMVCPVDGVTNATSTKMMAKARAMAMTMIFALML